MNYFRSGALMIEEVHVIHLILGALLFLIFQSHF